MTKKENTRLAQAEKQTMPPIERQFFSWAGNPWTPEQQAEAIRLHPRARFFWRTLLGKGCDRTGSGGRGNRAAGQRSHGGASEE